VPLVRPHGRRRRGRPRAGLTVLPLIPDLPPLSGGAATVTLRP
jgi:hypothetical protein